MVETTKRFAEARVNLTVGADAGGAVMHAFQGYSTPRELVILTGCCFSPMQAIVAGTRNAAEMMGREDEFGTIEAGKSADMLVLNGNPLENIKGVRDFDPLMLRGQVIERSDMTYANFRTRITEIADE